MKNRRSFQLHEKSRTEVQPVKKENHTGIVKYLSSLVEKHGTIPDRDVVKSVLT